MSKPPVLFTVNQDDGSTISFNPATGKWSCTAQGKTSSSSKFETVQQKRQEAAQPKALPKDQFVERTLLMIKQGPFSNKIDITPIKAKIEWDEKKKQPRLAKFKILNEPGSGWRDATSWRTVSLLNPNDLPSDLKQLLLNKKTQQTCQRLLEQTLAAVGDKWEATKTNTAKTYTINKDDALVEDVSSADQPAQKRSSFARSDRTFVMSSLWPVHMAKDNLQNIDELLDGWVPDADGALTWPQSSIRVRLLPSAPNDSMPTFVLEDASLSPRPLLRTQKWTTALFLGKATAQSSATQQPVITQWVVSDNTTPLSSSHLPRLTSVKQVVIHAAPPFQAERYLLTQTLPTPFPSRMRLSSSSEEPAWTWHKVESFESQKSVSLFNTGPEDAVFDHLAHLMTQEASLPRSSINTEEVLEASTALAVAHAYAQALDGEPDSSDKSLMSSWDKLEKALDKEVQQSQLVKDWEQECQKCLMVCETTLLQAALSPARPTRAP